MYWNIYSYFEWCEGGESNPYGCPGDPKSPASSNSATLAPNILLNYFFDPTSILLYTLPHYLVQYSGEPSPRHIIKLLTGTNERASLY